MGFRLFSVLRAKQILHRYISASTVSTAVDVPRGCLAVYVGENEKKRFVVPISYLNQSSFRGLLSVVEEEFGYHHPMGGLTIPCREDIFINMISRFNGSS